MRLNNGAFMDTPSENISRNTKKNTNEFSNEKLEDLFKSFRWSMDKIAHANGNTPK